MGLCLEEGVGRGETRRYSGKGFAALGSGGDRGAPPGRRAGDG